jgi:hypothetical protein
MAAAMFASPVRRSVPRWIEALIWLGLIVACWLAVTSPAGANTTDLTESAAWGAGQIAGTTLGLMIAGLRAWMVAHRFAIANLVVIMVGADILSLALLRSYRTAQSLQARIMLGEWFEVPLQRAPVGVYAPVPSAMEEWNRRAERAAAMLGGSFLAWGVQRLPSLASGSRRALTDDQAINIRAQLSAQSIGWYGPIVPAPAEMGFLDQEDESDRLAS